MGIKKVYLELTDKCNLNCTICYREAWQHSPIDMNKELLDGVVYKIKQLEEVEQIVLGGIGEPTLSPFFIETIEALSKFHITITTNGTLLNKELREVVVKYGDLVVVSIDGLERNYENVRGRGLKDVINNVKELMRIRNQSDTKKPEIYFQFVANRDNIDDIFGLIDLGADLGVDKIIMSNLLPQTEENSSKILYTRYENKEMKELLNKVRNYSFKRGINLLLPNIELKTERRCSFIEEDAVFITAKGDVVPCYRLSHSYDEYVYNRKKTVCKSTFGNIEEESLTDIWNSNKYRMFRENVYNNLYPSCIDCDLAIGCDMVKDTESNCYSISPSCGDCLWSRNIIICP